jgi:hypothetical protein
VDQHRDDRGLNRCLRAIGLPKSTYGDVCGFARLTLGHAGVAQKCLGAPGKSIKEAPDAPF